MSVGSSIIKLLSISGKEFSAGQITTILGAKRSSVDAALSRMRGSGDVEWADRDPRYGENTTWNYRVYFITNDEGE